MYSVLYARLQQSESICVRFEFMPTCAWSGGRKAGGIGKCSSGLASGFLTVRRLLGLLGLVGLTRLAGLVCPAKSPHRVV